jgi:hypothetical protein
MSVSLTCPFCRSVFTLAEVPAAGRTPCPNCGESVPVSADSTPAADPPAAAPPAVAASGQPGTSGVVFLSLGLTALIVAGFALWFFLGPKPPEPFTPLPNATTPPRAVNGLRYVPKDSQVVVVVQPSALDEYAAARGRTAERVFADLGLPADLFKTFADLGLRPQDIHSLVFAAHVDDLRATLVLTLRKPPADAARFRGKLNARGRDPAGVTLGGLPLVMSEVDDRTFVFALTEAGLTAARQPTAGYDDLPAGLKESIDRLSPSAFAWAATDGKEWAKAPQLKLVPAGVLPPEGVAKLDGVRAVAASLALEPNLWLVVSVRVNDSTVAAETADAMRAKLVDVAGSAGADGEWATASVPLESPAERLVDLKALWAK